MPDSVDDWDALFRDRRDEYPPEMRRRLDLRDRYHDAIAEGDLEALGRLAEEDSGPLHEVEVLLDAVHRHDRAVVWTLLELGASPDAVDASGDTALCLAARGGDFMVAKILLDHKADPDLRTPIIHAAGSPCRGIVRLLLEAGADPNRLPEDEGFDQEFPLDRRGECALFHAVVADARDIAADLAPLTRSPIRARARVALRRRLGRLNGPEPGAPPGPSDAMLLNASARGDLDDAGAALARGASIDPRDGSGRTPLWRAADAGHLDLVCFLLRLGADVEAVDQLSEQVPLIRAVLGGHADVVFELVAAGSDPGLPDGRHRSARDYARDGPPPVAEAIERAEGLA